MMYRNVREENLFGADGSTYQPIVTFATTMAKKRKAAKKTVKKAAKKTKKRK